MRESSRRRNRLFLSFLTGGGLMLALLALPLYGAPPERIRKVGKSPNFIVLNQAGTKAYVTSYADDRFLEVDLNTKLVTRSVTVGGAPLGFALADGEQTALIACRDSGMVTMVDLNTFRIIADIKAGAGPNTVAVDPRGYFAYVADSGRTSTGLLHIIDIRDRKATGTVKLGSSPFGLAISPTSERVFVLMGGSNEVWVVDPVKQAVISKLPVGDGPDGIAVTPDGKRVFVANSRDGDLTVIDAELLRAQITIPIGKMPFGVTISPDGRRVFVVNTASKTVAALPVDLSNLSGETFAVDKGSTDLKVSPDGRRLYVLSEATDSILIINLK